MKESTLKRLNDRIRNLKEVLDGYNYAIVYEEHGGGETGDEDPIIGGNILSMTNLFWSNFINWIPPSPIDFMNKGLEAYQDISSQLHFDNPPRDPRWVSTRLLKTYASMIRDSYLPYHLIPRINLVANDELIITGSPSIDSTMKLDALLLRRIGRDIYIKGIDVVTDTKMAREKQLLKKRDRMQVEYKVGIPYVTILSSSDEENWIANGLWGYKPEDVSEAIEFASSEEIKGIPLSSLASDAHNDIFNLIEEGYGRWHSFCGTKYSLTLREFIKQKV